MKLVQRHGAAVLPLVYLSSQALAANNVGLPHEVLNVSQAIVVPQAIIATVTELSTVNYTTTELITATESIVSTLQCPAPTSSREIFSIVFPSPDADAIEVTAQSQVLTSFVPEMTWCVPPGLHVVPVSGPPYSNATTTSYTTFISGTTSCETVYAPVMTTVCATTLTGLASKVTITDCTQEVTFSTECGFALETPSPVTRNASLITPAPTVKKTFTYWLAPWQSLTGGETPSDVDVKICTVLDSGDQECSRHQEVWEVIMVTKTMTTTRPIGFTATLSGPGTLMVETLQAVFTDTIETIGLSTTLLLETEVEIESTSTARKTSLSETTVNGGTSTVFITKTVVHRHSR